jgi:hypothetical protein
MFKFPCQAAYPSGAGYNWVGWQNMAFEEPVVG